MSDIADNAQDHIEREEAGRLAVRRQPGPSAIGSCLNCAIDFSRDQVSAGQRWCDADCLHDWERTQRAAAQKAKSE